MLLKIAEHVVSMDAEHIGHPIVRTLAAPFLVDPHGRAEVDFRFSREELEQQSRTYNGIEKARFEFTLYAAEFYNWMTLRDGFCLHSSAVAYQGRAYLFTANSGTGKSTHARLWRETFGPDVRMINDDRPILAPRDGVWTAYGAPWCGTGDLGENISAPVGAICYVIRSEHNEVKRLDAFEAFRRIFSQVPRPLNVDCMDALIKSIAAIVGTVPVYELRCANSPEAARTARDAICK